MNVSRETSAIVFKKMLDEVELPVTAYEAAIRRYEDLGEWFGREGSSLQRLSPYVFSQGSFRLGTAIRPVGAFNVYDLDLTCKLQNGVTKGSHTQEQLKNLVGSELAKYRETRRIQKELIAKHRCWRLEYQDELSFHMDIIPCIPEDEPRRRALTNALIESGMENVLANLTSGQSIAITDDRHANYKSICGNWNISNPEGYAGWFEDRMNVAKIMNLMEKAQVDKVPVYRRKTVLQQTVQLLKRHRDLMFKGNDNLKPISIIVTTLAARAYAGELDIATALSNILTRIPTLVDRSRPIIVNPVDPAENFADRWSMPECKHLKLAENFMRWLEQAKADFELIVSSGDAQFISNQANKKFSVSLNEADLSKALGLVGSSARTAPRVQVVKHEARPWGERN